MLGLDKSKLPSADANIGTKNIIIIKMKIIKDVKERLKILGIMNDHLSLYMRKWGRFYFPHYIKIVLK